MLSFCHALVTFSDVHLEADAPFPGCLPEHRMESLPAFMPLQCTVGCGAHLANRLSLTLKTELTVLVGLRCGVWSEVAQRFRNSNFRDVIHKNGVPDLLYRRKTTQPGKTLRLCRRKPHQVIHAYSKQARLRCTAKFLALDPTIFARVVTKIRE